MFQKNINGKLFLIGYPSIRADVGQNPEFLDQLTEADPDFGGPVGEAFEQALTAGELPPKTKLLIMMALDAAAGHEEGVENLAERARSAGASEAEIVETIEVVTMTSGFQGLATGSAGLQ